MNIKILLEGKIKEPYFKLGIDEFKKRLTGYTSLKIIETDSILNFAQTNIKQNSYQNKKIKK